MKAPEKLRPLFDAPHRHNKIEGGRGGGKSVSAAGLIALCMDRTPLNVLCGRETQKSLKDSSYAELEDAIRLNCDISRFRLARSESTIYGPNGNRAVFIGLREHTVDSIKSYKGFHWGWIEEAHAVSKKSLDVFIPTLRTDGWFGVDLGDGKQRAFPLRMFIYTMNPYSWDDPINGVLPDHREDVQKIIINYYDNPWFPEALEIERAQAEKTMHPDEYNRIWEGVPFEDAERAIIPREKIKAAMERTASRDGGRVVGADIARFGADRTQIYEREGMQVISEKTLTKKDTQTSARVIHDVAKGARIVVDDTGVGGGVTDKLKDMRDIVTPINFGAKAKNKKKYPDIISEMWFEFAEMIDQVGLPDDPELLQELSSRHFKYTNDERRKVESKEDYKKRTGRRSPDKADALLLCFYNKVSEMRGGTI